MMKCARWIRKINYFTCTNCGATYNEYDDDGKKQGLRYCPHCGAWMINTDFDGYYIELEDD